MLLPGPIGYGQVTPANYKLPCAKPQTPNPKPQTPNSKPQTLTRFTCSYRTNGLLSYVITHVLFAIICVVPSTRAWFGQEVSNALADNWGGILVMANM